VRPPLPKGQKPRLLADRSAGFIARHFTPKRFVAGMVSGIGSQTKNRLCSPKPSSPSLGSFTSLSAHFIYPLHWAVRCLTISLHSVKKRNCQKLRNCFFYFASSTKYFLPHFAPLAPTALLPL
jgi:hypothetical protein